MKRMLTRKIHVLQPFNSIAASNISLGPLLVSFVLPLLLGLTSGPSQVEFKKFSTSSVDDFVDHFSGDFQYLLPMFTLPGPNGGYDFSLNYSVVTAEQEASWIGLGWDLSVGAINRSVRGMSPER